MIVLYIVILIYFNFNITSIVNVFMLSKEKKKEHLTKKIKNHCYFSMTLQKCSLVESGKRGKNIYLSIAK